VTGRSRILVTGGCGFIGSHLVDALCARGDQVVVLDDLSTGRAGSIRPQLERGSARLVEGDVADPGTVEPLVRKVDRIYHLAAAVGVAYIVRDPIGAARTNVRGTQTVLEAAFRNGVPILFASSSEVYGKSAKLPFHEDDDRVLGTTSVQRWSYSTAKAMDEHLALAYAGSGLPVSVVRYFNSYGPRLDERGYGSVIARFVSQALTGRPLTVHGDGTQTRCFTYVTDTVRGTVLAAETAAARGRVINIGAGEEITIADLARTIRELVGSTTPIHLVPYADEYGPGFEDAPRRIPDTRRARELLGFVAEVPLRTGLSRTIDWCRANFALETSAP